MMQFIMFESNALFVAWQKRNPSVQMFQFSPVLLDMGGRVDPIDDNRSDIEMAVNFGCFVIYSLPDHTEEKS